MLRRSAFVALFFVAATLVLLHPLPLRLGSAVPITAQDPVLITAMLTWTSHALTTDPASLFDAPWLAPHRATLALADQVVGLTPLFGAFRLLGAGPFAAHNATLLLCFALSGFAMWLLVRDCTDDAVAQIAAGFIFAFCPFRFDHVTELNLQSAFLLPLSLRHLLRWCREARTRDLVLAAAFGMWQALCTWYLGFYLFLGSVVVLLAGPMRLVELATVRRALPLCAAAGVCVLVLAPFAAPYLAWHRSDPAVFTPDPAQVAGMSASLGDYFRVPEHNWLWGRSAGSWRNPGNDGWEHALFPGLVPLLLAGLGARRLWRFPSVRWALALVPLAFFLSFGPWIRLGSLESGGPLVPLPYALLYEGLPGVQGLRVVTRIWILGMLGLSVLAAFGVVHLRTGGRGRRLVPWLLVVCAAECASFPIPMKPVGEFREFAAAAALIRADVRQGAVLEFNPAWRARTASTDADSLSFFELAAMLRQPMHGRRIVNGHSAVELPSVAALRRDLASFPDVRSRDHLSALGVSHIVMRVDRIPPNERERFRRSLAVTRWLTLLGEPNGYAVFRLDHSR